MRSLKNGTENVQVKETINLDRKEGNGWYFARAGDVDMVTSCMGDQHGEKKKILFFRGHCVRRSPRVDSQRYSRHLLSSQVPLRTLTKYWTELEPDLARSWNTGLGKKNYKFFCRAFSRFCIGEVINFIHYWGSRCEGYCFDLCFIVIAIITITFLFYLEINKLTGVYIHSYLQNTIAHYL